jgi:effector-binding domain-containing protein
MIKISSLVSFAAVAAVLSAAVVAEAGTPSDPQVRQEAAMTVLSRPSTGSYQNISPMLGELSAYLKQKNVQPVGPVFVTFFNSPERTPEAELRWEVGVEIPSAVEVEPPYAVKSVQATQIAELICTGPYEQVGTCYGPLFSWIGKNGYRPAGPVRVSYMTEPGSVSSSQYQSLLAVPVTGGGAPPAH